MSTANIKFNRRDIETLRSAMEIMIDYARCGGGFDGKDWEDCHRVMKKLNRAEKTNG